MIQYACLKNKTLLPEGYRLITGQNCCAETAAAEFLSTKAQHKKTGDVQFYHYTQSFKVGENITPQTAHEIACEFARKNYPDYEVLIATHTDAPHIHSHFLIDYTQNQDPTLNYESKATYAAEFEGFRNMFLMLGGALSFIVGLVGILNFFNAILTGILTRRREFAMLQSIGMLCALVMAITISPRLSLIFLVAIAFLALVLVGIMIPTSKLFRQVFRKYDDLNASVQENVSAIRVVKSFVREAYESEKFRRAADSLYRLFVGAETRMSFVFPAMAVMFSKPIPLLSRSPCASETRLDSFSTN